MKAKVLITGAEGQLGKSLKKSFSKNSKYQLIYSDLKDLDISNTSRVINFFEKVKPAVVINAAAYTAVDKAEEHKDSAYLVNEKGPLNLAKACRAYDCLLFHVSTDYVYNGKTESYQHENDVTAPAGTYAKSKLAGELRIQEQWEKHFILRTSWLYSEYGNNFVKTMLKLGRERKSLKVVSDQIGSPTYAGDLANAIVTMIDHAFDDDLKQTASFGVYNYSNHGEISWYDFAVKIFELAKMEVNVQAINSEEYPVLAPRPLNSRMDKNKIEIAFDLEIPSWEESLKKCLALLDC